MVKYGLHVNNQYATYMYNFGKFGKNTRKIKDNINWYWGLLNMNGYNTHKV